jgi:MOSC domain-containing protein YiiM
MNKVQRGKVLAVNTSEDKGTKKTNVQSCSLLKDFGLKGDAHGGPWHRQVSLLANESIEKMRAKGLNVGCGDFAEILPQKVWTSFIFPLEQKFALGILSPYVLLKLEKSVMSAVPFTTRQGIV